jgi:type IV secretory pathway protease TraF
MNVKRFVIVAVVPAIAASSIVLLLGVFGILLNIASNSLPPGLYRIVPAGKGSDLLICPTGVAERVSIEREYRVKSFGCGDGYAPLLKPIAARAGDTVTLSEAGVAVNGKLLQNSKQYPKDAIGRPMPLVRSEPMPSFLGRYGSFPPTTATASIAATLAQSMSMKRFNMQNSSGSSKTALMAGFVALVIGAVAWSGQPHRRSAPMEYPN